MGEHMHRFLAENEHLTLISAASAEDRALLLKAQERGYITLTIAPNGKKCFTQSDLEQARMWKEKGCLD